MLMQLIGHTPSKQVVVGSIPAGRAILILRRPESSLDVGGGIRLNFCLLCIVIAVTAHVKMLIFVSYSIAGGHLV